MNNGEQMGVSKPNAAQQALEEHIDRQIAQALARQ